MVNQSVYVSHQGSHKGKSKISKGTEFLTQSQIFEYLYLCNLKVNTFDISLLEISKFYRLFKNPILRTFLSAISVILKFHISFSQTNVNNFFLQKITKEIKPDLFTNVEKKIISRIASTIHL